MAQTSNDQLVTATGPEKAGAPEAICAYDGAHGEYRGNIEPNQTRAQRPSPNPTTPFRLGGK